MALVENNVRRLLPKSGRQHLWSDLPSEVLPFLLPSRFCPSDKFMRFAQREFGGCGDGVARVMAMLEWIHRTVDRTNLGFRMGTKKTPPLPCGGRP